MATLTAWRFSTPQGADFALKKLEKLHSEMVINLHDAAVVLWEVGHKKPKQVAKLREAFGLED